MINKEIILEKVEKKEKMKARNFWSIKVETIALYSFAYYTYSLQCSIFSKVIVVALSQQLLHYSFALHPVRHSLNIAIRKKKYIFLRL